MIVVSLSLDAFDIRAMSELSQRKATNVLQLGSSFQIDLMFLSAQIGQRPRIQVNMHARLDTIPIVIVDIGTTH